MPKVFKPYLDKMGNRSIDSFIGEKGELFYDPDGVGIRIGDGITPGGIDLEARWAASAGTPFTLAPDASAAVNDAAIVAAMATGRQVVLSGGEFATAGLSFTSSVRLRMEGGAKFRRTDQTKPALEIKLPWGAILNVSSITQETVVIPPYAGNQTVDVLTFTGLDAGALAAAGLTANKFARIVSNDYIPWGTGPRDSERLGESARIFDIVDTAGPRECHLVRKTSRIRRSVHNYGGTLAMQSVLQLRLNWSRRPT